MAFLKQPFGIKDLFGKIKLQLTRDDKTGVDAKATDDGVLRVFLEGQDSAGVEVDAKASVEQTELTGWLKVIAFQLGELNKKHISPRDLKGYGDIYNKET